MKDIPASIANDTACPAFMAFFHTATGRENNKGEGDGNHQIINVVKSEALV